MLQPTSRFLFYCVLVLAGIIFVAAVVCYRKNKGIKFFTACFLTALLVSAAAGLQINIARGYVDSWAELPALVGLVNRPPIPLTKVQVPQINTAIAGSDLDSPDVITDVDRAAAAADETDSALTAAEQAQYKADFKPVTDPNLLGADFTGELRETFFRGPKSQVAQPVRIWLPAGWQQLSELKVVLFLHGYPSNPEFNPLSLGVGQQLGPLMAAGKLAPTALVFPELRPDAQEPDCVDLQGRPKIGTFVVDDLVKLVKANFPVSRARADWALSGNSAGAYCAGLLAGFYPAQFGSSIILSGYDDPQLGSLKLLSRKDQQQFYVSNVIGNTQLPMKVYNFGAGKDEDAKLLTERIAQLENPNVQVTNVYDPNGSHNWKTWHNALPDAMLWFAPTAQYLAQAPAHAADHSIGGEASWATKITIGYIELCYLIVAGCWVVFLLCRFSNKAAALAASARARGARIFLRKTAAAADVGVPDANTSENANAITASASSSTSVSTSTSTSAAICASLFTVVLIGGGFALLVNAKMGTISNLSNATALLQLIGL